MICETCKFAKWLLTANGRKHPSGEGQCTWEKKVFLPASASHPNMFGERRTQAVLLGGFICRAKGREFPTKCRTYQPMKGD